MHSARFYTSFLPEQRPGFTVKCLGKAAFSADRGHERTGQDMNDHSDYEHLVVCALTGVYRKGQERSKHRPHYL